jgi:hypothetical protein
VYQRVFVADGNFKADHVRQKKLSNDIWLSEGGGMAPKRSEYFSFLKTALEQNTVRGFHSGADADADADSISVFYLPSRKLPVKLRLGQLRTPSSPQLPAM